jgi:hypothetical protein
VERVIVWGGIIVLLGLVAVEGRARKGYAWTLSALETEIAKDEGATGQPLYVKDIDKHLLGWPKRVETESGSYKKITLTWDGILPPRTYGIDLTYDKRELSGEPPAVLSLATHGAPEPPPPARSAEDTEFVPAGGMPPPGAGAPGGGPPGGGGPGGRGRPEGEPAPEGESPGATPPEANATDKPAESPPDDTKPEGESATPAEPGQPEAGAP